MHAVYVHLHTSYYAARFNNTCLVTDCSTPHNNNTHGDGDAHVTHNINDHVTEDGQIIGSDPHFHEFRHIPFGANYVSGLQIKKMIGRLWIVNRVLLVQVGVNIAQGFQKEQKFPTDRQCKMFP
jgi:hypothetical protein